MHQARGVHQAREHVCPSRPTHPSSWVPPDPPRRPSGRREPGLLQKSPRVEEDRSPILRVFCGGPVDAEMRSGVVGPSGSSVSVTG